MAKRRSEWTEDELDEMLASAGRGVEAISRSERFAIEVEVIESSRPLSEGEVRDKDRLERTVERAFYEAGRALQELRNRRLYRDEYDSFEDYCRGRFGHSRQKANYLIVGAAIYRTLSAANCPLLPSSEYQVRPLAVLPPPRQPSVWNEAVAEAWGKTPSNRLVRKTVGKYRDQGKANVFEVGEVVGILAKDNPRLKGKNNYWAIVTAVHPRSCDLRLHDGAIDLVKIEYLKELGYTEGDCQTVRRLCERKALATRDRFSRLREGEELEDAAVAFLGILGKLQRPYLSVRRGNADHAREVLRGSDRLIFVLDWRSFPPNYRDPRSRDYERTRDLGVLELIDRPRTGSPSLSARHESKATLPATRTGFRPDYLRPIRSLYTRKIRVVGRF